MALSGKFISFEPIIESVYRRAGYQYIDWAEALEVVGETLRLIAAYPAFKEITTNGQGTNPVPVEIVDFKATLPSDLLVFKTARKIELKQVDDGLGGTNLVISSFVPMVETSDLFYQSPSQQWKEPLPSGTYDYTAFKQQDKIQLSGTSGTASITGTASLTKTVTFDTDLTTTAAAFVTANATEYLAEEVVLTSEDEYLIFTSYVSGTAFTSPTITNVSGDLTGDLVEGQYSEPLVVIGEEFQVPTEYNYSYKINNNIIYTNFQTGFIEVVYTGFVTDDYGFPMIPDEQRFIDAIRWAIIEHIDYKKWRVGEITDKVYEKSVQERAWYIASAKTKADIPSIEKMEALKNAALRSITKVGAHDNYFRYLNKGEQRFTHNRK